MTLIEQNEEVQNRNHDVNTKRMSDKKKTGISNIDVTRNNDNNVERG